MFGHDGSLQCYVGCRVCCVLKYVTWLCCHGFEIDVQFDSVDLVLSILMLMNGMILEWTKQYLDLGWSRFTFIGLRVRAYVLGLKVSMM